eukprot:490915_1
MGNLQKSAVSNTDEFCNDNLCKISLGNHFGKIFGITMLYLESTNQIMIATIGKDGKMLIRLFNENYIKQFSNKKKAKILKNKTFLYMAITMNSSYNMTIASIFNKQLNCILIACGGLCNTCTIRKIDYINRVNSILCEIEVCNGYVSVIKFINDNTNRVIIGSGDANIYICDYIRNEKLLTIDKCNGDICDIDCFQITQNDINILIIAFGALDGFVYIVNINENDINNMEIINIDSIELFGNYDVNCIAFSPNNNHKFIVCGDNFGCCCVLVKNKKENIIKYEIGIDVYDMLCDNKTIDEWNSVYSVCWLN